MMMFVTAVAIAAATPVAAQAIVPAHSDHDAVAPERSDKGCCDRQAADKANANKSKMQAGGNKLAAQHSEHNQ